MPEEANLIGFVAAALVVLLVPGPGVLYVLARSLSQGQGAGIVSVCGLSAGALVHVAAATAGLSAVLMTSATAFGVVKILGAGYLIYLGIRALRVREASDTLPTPAARATRRLFWDGVLVSVLNPKIALFFLAFLPQFVSPSRGPIAHQVLFLGVLYVALAFVTDSAYAVAASRLREWQKHRVKRSRVPRYAEGAIYLGLGLRTALADQH